VNRAAATVLTLALTLVVLAGGPGGSGAAPPAGEVGQAVRSLGSPGLLWGRLALEQESPEGPWTPIGGVEVTAYPFAARVAADLEEIRQRARDSGAAYDAGVARLRERLQAHAAQVEAAVKDLAPDLAGTGGVVQRRTTDASGVFVFEALPSGDWLLVALRLSDYAAPHAQREPRRGASPGRDSTFLPRPQTPTKEAEIWLVRVRVDPDTRVRVWLTDRGRFMVGPLRQ
jgi:hypothetical protein